MHALERILRFRRLSEQQARRELERATQMLRAANAARERLSKMVAEQRASLANSWVPENSEDRKLRSLPTSARNSAASAGVAHDWLIEEAALEFSGWNHMQLEQVCAAEARRIEPLVAHYIECRRSLRQTEKLVEQQVEAARVGQERKTQAEADEWFLQQNLGRRKKVSST